MPRLTGQKSLTSSHPFKKHLLITFFSSFAGCQIIKRKALCVISFVMQSLATQASSSPKCARTNNFEAIRIITLMCLRFTRGSVLWYKKKKFHKSKSKAFLEILSFWYRCVGSLMRWLLGLNGQKSFADGFVYIWHSRRDKARFQRILNYFPQ